METADTDAASLYTDNAALTFDGSIGPLLGDLALTSAMRLKGALSSAARKHIRARGASPARLLSSSMGKLRWRSANRLPEALRMSSIKDMIRPPSSVRRRPSAGKELHLLP